MFGLLAAAGAAIVGVGCIVNYAIKKERRRQRAFEEKTISILDSVKNAAIDQKIESLKLLKKEAQINLEDNFKKRNNCQETIQGLKMKLKLRVILTQNFKRTLRASISHWEEKRDFFNRSISFWITEKKQVKWSIVKII